MKKRKGEKQRCGQERVFWTDAEVREREEEAGSQKPCNPEDTSYLRNESKASLTERMSIKERLGSIIYESCCQRFLSAICTLVCRAYQTLPPQKQIKCSNASRYCTPALALLLQKITWKMLMQHFNLIFKCHLNRSSCFVRQKLA